jgi:hypothetical protein
VSTLFELHEPYVTLVEYFCAHPCIPPPQDGLPNVQIVITTTTSLKITRLVVNQLTCLCNGASYHKNILCFRLIMWRLCDNIRYVINICDDTIYICHLMCDWSLGAHKIMHSICSLKMGVTESKLNRKNRRQNCPVPVFFGTDQFQELNFLGNRGTELKNRMPRLNGSAGMTCGLIAWQDEWGWS